MPHRVKVQTGHVSKFWSDDFKKLNYVKQDVTDEEIAHWYSLGYDQRYVKSFTGSMYDSRNPMPDWVDNLKSLFGMYDQTYTFYKMNTCEIMPVHSDHYNTYCRIHDTSPIKVERAILMLEDWKPGHYFELDGIGYTNWKAGDWFKWTNDTPHAASNIGTEPRYTLQITGKSVYEGQLNKLFFHNIPGIRSNCGHPMIENDILYRVPEKRVMLYMNNRHITELNDINHDDPARDILNQEGLHIYLYEPLCSYDVTNPALTMGFYSEFSPTVKSDDLRAEELDSINEYATRNKLTNVTVHTCDYDVKNWYPYYKNLNLICDDLFIKTQKLIHNVNTEFRNQFNENFVCLNWRFTNHRQLMATFLAGDSGYLSWYHKSSFDDLNNNLFFDLETWKTDYIEHYCRLRNNSELVEQNAPFVVDIVPKEIVEDVNVDKIYPLTEGYSFGETPALHNLLSNRLADVYVNSFVDIITETRFAQPTGNFSEQVTQAIQYKKPFVLAAPPKTLEYIRSYGFKTFGDYWDESYDDEYDHSERLAKIFNIINDIVNLPIEEKREMYENMRSIVDHNFQVFKELVKK